MSLPSSTLHQDIRLIREIRLSLLGPRESLLPGTLLLLSLLPFWSEDKRYGLRLLTWRICSPKVPRWMMPPRTSWFSWDWRERTDPTSGILCLVVSGSGAVEESQTSNNSDIRVLPSKVMLTWSADLEFDIAELDLFILFGSLLISYWAERLLSVITLIGQREKEYYREEQLIKFNPNSKQVNK